MAENREDRSREDLTEEASPFRVEEYRRKGIVAQSRELSGLMALIASVAAIYMIFPSWGIQMSEFMREVFRSDLSARADLGATGILRGYFIKAGSILISVGLPICGAGFIVGVLGSFVQIGSIFSLDPLTPDLEKINPLAGIRRMVSMRQFYEGIRLTIKLGVVLVVAYLLMKSEILNSPTHMGGEPNYLLVTLGKSATSVFLSLAAILTLFSVIDFGMQKYEYQQNLKQTKQEAKQENKEREGDPQIRARIRTIQREMARRRMMDAVKKADVVVTNPTHIAVALSYEKTSMSAPKVVAKGADFLAQKIKQVASDAGVPLVENVPLARTLYKSVKVGKAIPRNLYQAVAEVLAYVYRLRRKDT